MFLILSQNLTEFSLRLKYAAERKGLKALLLTSAEIAQDLALVFDLTEENVSLCLRYQGVSISTSDIEGVYCEINAFDYSLWERFSPQDAQYAAQETQALWLAILASLPCRVVNPPALDTLAGTLLSTPEILYLAHRLGFPIPMVVSLESGKIASELLATGATVFYTDLGEVSINEISLSEGDLVSLAQNENHIRVKEELHGKRVYVTMVGYRFLSCKPDANGSVKCVPASQVPRPVRNRLRTLHKQLNTNLMEYCFRVMEDGTWVFCGCGRPPVLTVAAYGDALFDQIVDFAIEKRGDTW